MAKVCQPGDPRDFGEEMVYAQKLEMQRDRLREALIAAADLIQSKNATVTQHYMVVQQARAALEEIDNG